MKKFSFIILILGILVTLGTHTVFIGLAIGERAEGVRAHTQIRVQNEHIALLHATPVRPVSLLEKDAREAGFSEPLATFYATARPLGTVASANGL